MRSEQKYEPLARAMNRAVQEGVFPGGVLLAAYKGEVAAACPAGRLTLDPESPAVNLGTIYDLASLTKVLSTAILTMVFIERGHFALETTLNELWPGPVPEDKKALTLTQLLNHTTGLPAWRPYYEILEIIPIDSRRSRAAELILDESLESVPGERSEYSDLNFILLGLILEEIGREQQDVLFNRFIAQPLGLKDTGYRPLNRDVVSSSENIAPTEVLPGRGEALRGEVHDQNAHALTGVAGHAGLFGPAGEVWLIIKALRDAYRDEPGLLPVSGPTVRTFWQRSGPARALGFDLPSETGSAAGELFSKNSVGHLGYTGTSLWYDPVLDLCVILLTNRVHPSSTNQAIRNFRPFIHDLVVETVT